MLTVDIMNNGDAQSINLPKECRIDSQQMVIVQLGKSILLVPKEKQWEVFMEGINGFTDDYFEALENRPSEIVSERVEL